MTPRWDSHVEELDDVQIERVEARPFVVGSISSKRDRGGGFAVCEQAEVRSKRGSGWKTVVAVAGFLSAVHVTRSHEEKGAAPAAEFKRPVFVPCFRNCVIEYCLTKNDGMSGI